MNKSWLVSRGTYHSGPFSTEELETFYHDQDIKEDTPICLEEEEYDDKWVPLNQREEFQFLFYQEPPPPRPDTLPEAPLERSYNSDVRNGFNIPPVKKKFPYLKYLSIFTVTLTLFFFVRYILKDTDTRLPLKPSNLTQFYADKLQATANKKTDEFDMALALSLDGRSLWGSTNYPGDISVDIQLKSIPKRIFGSEEVLVTIKGDFKKHIGHFTVMYLTHGSSFLPGEYSMDVIAHETHSINRKFTSLADISYFKSMNKTYTYEGTTLIYPGTPTEYEQKLKEFYPK